MDPNREFEAAIERLRQLSASENEQVAVKAASDLAKLMRAHVRIASEPEESSDTIEAKLIEACVSYLWTLAKFIRERKVDPAYVREHLAQVASALAEVENAA